MLQTDPQDEKSVMHGSIIKADQPLFRGGGARGLGGRKPPQGVALISM